MPPESATMFEAKAEDSSKKTIDDHREAVERSLASLKQAAAAAETEEELDAIHAKMLELAEEYKAAAAQAHDDERAAESNIKKGPPMTFTGDNGDSIVSTGEQEKFGLHVGQKLKVTEYGRARVRASFQYAKTLVVAGFTNDDMLIIQNKDELIDTYWNFVTPMDPRVFVSDEDSFKLYFELIP